VTSGSSTILTWLGVTLSSDGFPFILTQHKTASCSSTVYQVTAFYCPSNNCSSGNVIRTVVGVTDSRCNAGSYCNGASETFGLVTPPGQHSAAVYYNQTSCSVYALYCKSADCSTFATEDLGLTTTRVVPAHTGGLVMNYLLNVGGQLTYGSFYCLSKNRGNCTNNRITLPSTGISSSGAFGGDFVYYSNRTFYAFGTQGFSINGAMTLADVSDEINAATPVSAPIAPAPVAPAPIAPAPVAPAPIAPAPVAPAPVAPAPVAPSPVATAPVAPAPVAATPTTPSPAAPAPVAPVPVPSASPMAVPSQPPAGPSPVSPAPAASAPIASPESIPASPAAEGPTAAPQAGEAPSVEAQPSTSTAPSSTPAGSPANSSTKAPVGNQISSSSSLCIGVTALVCALTPFLL
jgi:hypothetical protein